MANLLTFRHPGCTFTISQNVTGAIPDLTGPANADGSGAQAHDLSAFCCVMEGVTVCGLRGCHFVQGVKEDEGILFLTCSFTPEGVSPTPPERSDTPSLRQTRQEPGWDRAPGMSWEMGWR